VAEEGVLHLLDKLRPYDDDSHQHSDDYADEEDGEDFHL
jgi:hypothetical protein